LDPFKIPRGKHTYGSEPQVIGEWVYLPGSKIGSFCSIAGNFQWHCQAIHPTTWISQFPFQPLWKMNTIPLVPEEEKPPKPIIIGSDVWIATDVCIMKGVTVGDGSIICMKSFVTKDVPPYTMVGGYPAEIIRYRFSSEQIEQLLKIKWWDWEDDEIRKVVPYLASDRVDEFIQYCRDNGKV
jgi:chloramphenicol O-acetyltransferase type B